MATFTGGLPRARELLSERFGLTAFRVHQLKVLGPLLAGRSVLAVLPTGAGKSLCYQLPALMARGLTLVVSPLISLMQDQVAALRRRGIPAAYLNSLLSSDERRAILDAALSGRLVLLYCAPERLGSLVRQLARAGREVSLLAVDEAHCIVEWGNEFRPVYRQLDRYRYLLTELVTRAMLRMGVRAAPYHAGLTGGTRRRVLRAFLADRAPVVVATSAFGMGIDKPDVRRVLHWGPPRTVEAYYQEAGRAGRDGRRSECVVVWRPADFAWGDAATDMRRYVETRTCRRAALLAYFGERGTACSGCDVCGLEGWRPSS